MPDLNNVLSWPTDSDRMRYAVDQCMEGLALLDAEGHYTYMNQAHAAMYGFTSDELMDKSWKVLYEPNTIALIEAKYFPLLLAQGHWSGELTGRKKTGSLFSAEVSLDLVKREEGQLEGLICTCRDITNRKRLESRVKQRSLALSEAVQALRNENRARRHLEQEREKLLEQVTEGRARLQALSRSLLETQEMERHKLSRDLHDEVGQSLTALKVNLQTILEQQPAAFVSAPIGESVLIVDRMIESVRSLSLNLRPSLLDDIGLIPALRWYLRRQAERLNWKRRFTAENCCTRYRDDLQIACFRIAQEALTNVARHANATRVTVRLSEKETVLELVVRDNGVGFSLAHARTSAKKGQSLGLLGMEERARLVHGHITITSHRGRGTTMRAVFPLSPRVKTEERNRH
jgi:PAS domain S-box-containing protein